MELVSGLSLANLTQRPSWWYMRHSAKMDSRYKDFGMLVGHLDSSLLSPFDFSQTVLAGGSLLVLHSLPGPLV